MSLGDILRICDELFIAEEAELLTKPTVNISTYAVCVVDGKPIKTMTFKNTGVCSELCRKRHANEITAEQYLDQKRER